MKEGLGKEVPSWFEMDAVYDCVKIGCGPGE